MTENKTPQQKSLAARFILRLITFYQKAISPQTPACCRYTPSCSNYAKDAITIHGAFYGSLLAVWRILRCNPFGKGGYDPVPEKTKLCTCKEGSKGRISLSKH
ncbi:MAG: membrane protein insertion efficiency factor YidD [Clostridiaceae bacterium]|nr:membrane protein insertion efficiency factor YidD [Clostridiaceae bacterium]